jgi:serine/threonine protein kinase
VSEHKTHVSAATMGTVSYMPPEMLSEQRLTKAVRRCKGAGDAWSAGWPAPKHGGRHCPDHCLDSQCVGSSQPSGTHTQVALQVDVYSLGVIMCQLYSGATPYAGMGMPAVLFAVVQKAQRPDVPPDMPPDYRELMQRCWDSDLRARCPARPHASFLHAASAPTCNPVAEAPHVSGRRLLSGGAVLNDT